MNFLDRLDVDSLRDKPLADFTPSELAGFLIQKFSGDPITHLNILYNNRDIGSVLYKQTMIMMRGAGYDKREEEVFRVSIKNSPRGSSYKIRSSNN